jgi:hypothetical protein
VGNSRNHTRHLRHTRKPQRELTAANAVDAGGKFTARCHDSQLTTLIFYTSLVCLVFLVWFNFTPVYQTDVYRPPDSKPRPLRSPRFQHIPQRNTPEHPASLKIRLIRVLSFTIHYSPFTTQLKTDSPPCVLQNISWHRSSIHHCHHK